MRKIECEVKVALGERIRERVRVIDWVEGELRQPV